MRVRSGYFEVPLVRAYEIFKEAYSQVSGLSRSVRGPSMSAFPGKVRVLGVVTLRELMDANVLDAIRESVGFELLGDPGGPLMVCDFIQARNPDWIDSCGLRRRCRHCAAYARNHPPCPLRRSTA